MNPIIRISVSLFLVTFLFTITSCVDDPSVDGNENEAFDRKAMLEFWSDEMIGPSYENYLAEVNQLVDAKNNFIADPDLASYEALTNQWFESYKSWQQVSFIEIGKAEELGLRNFTNIYPTDENKILAFIETGEYDLDMPSNSDCQGFPALDFLLFGLGEGDSDWEILSEEKYTNYLNDIVERLALHAEIVVDHWTTDFNKTFVANAGSSATASVDKLINDYVFYFEKFLRAGKIGIPAGVFSGSTLAHNVEARNAKIYSKAFFFEALNTCKKFYSGQSFDESKTGPGLSEYILTVNPSSSNPLDESIMDAFDQIEEKAALLEDDFALQIESDNMRMLETYDEIQKLLVLFKVDMMQALNIHIDYVDADGD